MFSKETYINRRAILKKLVGSGVIVIFGNNESPCNYPANAYYPFRQDSTFYITSGRTAMDWWVSSTWTMTARRLWAMISI